jgi:hypothetical protein
MISGMVNAVGLSVSASLFVSDSAICYSSGSMITIEHQLQIAVNLLSHWALQNTFSFLILKAPVCMLLAIAGFSSSSRSVPQESTLPFASAIKFLGLLDSKLMGISLVMTPH